MKHIQSFESFINESESFTSKGSGIIAQWDYNKKEIDFTPGGSDGMTSSGIRCAGGGFIESYYRGMGRGYEYDLGIICREDKWEKVGPAITDDLNNAGMWLGGVISRPIDKKAKAEVIAIIKKHTK